ncbi:MAG: hypothetical protein NW241_09240 [Bacteroidia bacterium]|nr:hypothetical protein [Bacteroidia bacterium]
MRQLFTLMMLPGLMFSQNAMFIPFGQTRSDVLAHLSTRDYARHAAAETDTLINPVSARQTVQYFFRRDVLYAIEDARTFPTAKEAQKAVESCLAYMGRADLKVKSLEDLDGAAHYGSVEEDRVVELIVRYGRRKGEPSLVRLSARSRLYGPRMDTEALAERLNHRN